MAGTAGCYDVVIIGGGINGAGLARDAAMRGLTVLLLEQNDFGSGTTSWSSRLIHGGLRYLEHAELSLVYESLHERHRLLRAAPHLVRPLRINIPVYEHGRRGKLLIRAGMIAYDLLSIRKSLPRHRMLSRRELLREEPGLNPDGLAGGARYWDAQAAFPERLVIENVIAAAEAGADVRNYSPVTAIDVQDARVRAVRFRDSASGGEAEARARVVVNAAGPWVDRVLARTGAPFPKLTGGTKGSHIVVGSFEGAPRDAFYVEARADARPLFIIPWNGQYLIGTTDIRYDADPAEARASDPEIAYLLAETNRIFPKAALNARDIHYAYAGIRPLPFQSAGPEASITRRHIVRAHDDRARGLLSVIGGKLTTYRALSEQLVDQAVERFSLEAGGCRTRDTLLPGAAGLGAAKVEIAEARCLTGAAGDRLLRVYGGRAIGILELLRPRPDFEQTPDASRNVLAAEVAFAVRHEFALSLVDLLHRRMMIGLSADLGTLAAGDVAAVAARELGWDDEETARQLAALDDYNARLAIAEVEPQ
jgi:glycerol-3-phosphate dehydrogenase